MKMFIKLAVALFAIGFATVNAATTYTDLAAAKAAVAAAVNAAQSGNQSDIDSLKDTIASAVSQFPESADEIVEAGFNATGITPALRILIVKVAAWNAPEELASIKLKIGNANIDDQTKIDLKALADRVADVSDGFERGKRTAHPPASVS